MSNNAKLANPMNAKRAVELHFADSIIERDGEAVTNSVQFARKPFVQQVTNRVNEHFHIETPAPTVNAADLYERLKNIKEQF